MRACLNASAYSCVGVVTPPRSENSDDCGGSVAFACDCLRRVRAMVLNGMPVLGLQQGQHGRHET